MSIGIFNKGVKIQVGGRALAVAVADGALVAADRRVRHRQLLVLVALPHCAPADPPLVTPLPHIDLQAGLQDPASSSRLPYSKALFRCILSAAASPLAQKLVKVAMLKAALCTSHGNVGPQSRPAREHQDQRFVTIAALLKAVALWCCWAPG